MIKPNISRENNKTKFYGWFRKLCHYIEKNKCYPNLPSYAKVTSRLMKYIGDRYIWKFNEKYIRQFLCDIGTRKNIL